VRVTVPAAEVELVADELFAMGASAVSETPAPDGSVGLVADVDPADLVGRDWQVQVLETEASWTTGWHDAARAWRCGRRLVVRPHWVDPLPVSPPGDDPPQGDEPLVEVVLDPGTSFGAGSHPSTRLCLAALEPLAPGAASVLDVGSGTGVLGVAALLLGADRLCAIDVDPAAVTATARAVELNGVSTRATVSAMPLDEVPEPADLVLANLLLAVLEPLAPALVAHVAPAGALVLGGVLEDQLERAVAALAPLVLADVLRDGDWVAAVLRHP
jgi:ribosomal protein L11 methyltransferase